MNAPLQDGWTPDVARILIDAIHRELFELHTGLPAEVQAYDKDAQTVDVQPMLLRYYWSDADEPVVEEHKLPLLRGVPVWFPAGGGWCFHFPLAAGDTVYLTFAERAIGRWLASEPGQFAEPESTRKMDLSDAVAFPGLRQLSRALANLSTSNLVIGREDGSTVIEMSPDGDVWITGARVRLGGRTGGAPVARTGDAVQIQDPAFATWMAAVGAATFVSPTPSTVAGVITGGSSTVEAT